ncbi:molybdopterin-binding protein [Lentzea sp. HUAS12]|uniref:molybdopterin-binding protein n=1 Tax=Lentzea sp. HUAS12 TaxID=2951806 RepID=UPI00209F743A|nr:molybdopterin-binding protein [Lentzea sp. HUAS12]USX54587.1 molybdopterin-binding protein [Lentzea sp. HUAS12]
MTSSFAGIPTPRTPLSEDQVLVTGDINHEWVFRTSHLDAHARDPVNVQYRTTRVREVHQVQGVPLHDVLGRVGLRTSEGSKMDELSFVVVASSADGYRVLLSWAEVDPEFGACSALLATRYNGRLLTRPTLVTPRDGRASRYVRDVARLEITRFGVGRA